MYITFKHVDKNYYGKSEYITPVVEIATENDVFFGILCEILNTYNEYNEHIVVDINKAMNLAEYKVKDAGVDINAYKELKEKVYNFYWNIVDDDFAKELKKYDEDLYYTSKLAYPDVRLARFRGILFEELVTELVKKRFIGYLFETGCQVYINKSRVIAYYGEGNSHHKETIDIAGWEKQSKYGEFYECKINPDRFNEEHFRYLIELNLQLNSNGAKKCKVAFVSADTTLHVQARKEYLKETNGILNDEILLIGRENVYAIGDYAIPEIA